VPISITLDEKAYKGTMNAFARLRSYMKSPEKLAELLEEWVELVYKDVRDFTPEVTGEIKKHWFMDRVGDLKWAIYNTLEEALFVEYSSRPHTIVPKDREALYFKIDGREIFATRVEHPGVRTPAAPLRKALKHRQKLLAKIENTAVDKLAELWGRD